MEVAVADSFQGLCFLQGCADLAGDSQRLAVVVAARPVAEVQDASSPTPFST